MPTSPAGLGRRFPAARHAPAAALVLAALAACRGVPPGLRTPEAMPAVYGGAGAERPEGYALVSFFAYGPGTLTAADGLSLTGHAFVSINDAGAWGYYPVPAGRPFSKTGVTRYSLDWPPPVEEADFFVAPPVLERVTRLIGRWRDAPPAFVLLKNDCVTFVYQICEVMGLRYSRGALLPTTAVRRIRLLNGTNAPGKR